MDEQRKYAILFAATILAARNSAKYVSSHARRGSAPLLTQSRTPSASSKRLMSGGQAGQIERIGAGGIREP